MTDDDKALVERLRWSDGWFFENPWDHVVYASDDPLEAADRIEAQAAEIERLREALREVRSCTGEHYGAARALKIISAALGDKYEAQASQD